MNEKPMSRDSRVFAHLVMKTFIRRFGSRWTRIRRLSVTSGAVGFATVLPQSAGRGRVSRIWAAVRHFMNSGEITGIHEFAICEADLPCPVLGDVLESLERDLRSQNDRFAFGSSQHLAGDDATRNDQVRTFPSP